MALRAILAAASDARRLVWAMAVVALCGVGGAAAATPDDLDALRQRALELVNTARQQHGLSRLELGGNLNEAAQSHAADMLRRGYYSHVSPNGDDVQDRYLAAGGSESELVAENIARCRGCEPPVTADRVEWLHEGWMNSPEHRANILREGLSRFGFGIAVDQQKGLYAVQTFAGPGTPRGAGEGGAEAAALTEQEIAARATRLINEARAKADLGDLRASPALTEAARNLLPDPNAGSAGLQIRGNLYEALPTGERGQWRSLAVVAGMCSGCGAEPTAADLRFFRQQWLQKPEYRQRLLDPNANEMGFAMQATGVGRKTAVLVLGTER